MEPCCPLPLNSPMGGGCATSATDLPQHFSPIALQKGLHSAFPLDSSEHVFRGQSWDTSPAPRPLTQACFHLRGSSQSSSVVDSHPLGDQGTKRDPWIPMGAFKLRLTQHSGRVVRK